MASLNLFLFLLCVFFQLSSSSPVSERNNKPATCKKTKVAVLGAGVAGITAAVGRLMFGYAVADDFSASFE